MTNPTPPSREELERYVHLYPNEEGRLARTLLAVMDACTPERLDALKRFRERMIETGEHESWCDLVDDLRLELRNALDIGNGRG